MPQSLDWDKLKSFHAAAETGSLTAAAERLKISQSAVSRQITSLETYLGSPLFHRHARGLRLTEQGNILYRATRDVSQQLAVVQKKVSDSREQPQGTLRVSTPISLGSNWLMSILPAFMEKYPEIDLQLILDDEEHDLSNMEIDCALRPWPTVSGDVIERKIGTISQSLYASDTYLAKRGAPKDIDDLENHDIIAFGELKPKRLHSTNWVLSVGRENKTPLKPVLEVNNLHGIMRAGEAGLGIIGIPDYMVSLSRRLVRVLPQVKGKSFDVFFVYPTELRGSVKAKVFREFLVDVTKNWDSQS